MMQVWAGFQLPSRHNENAQCQVLHHSGEWCIKQSFCALTSSSSNIKHRNLPARSEFITSSCSGCRVKFSPCCDIQLQPWDLRGPCEIIGMQSIFIRLTQGKEIAWTFFSSLERFPLHSSALCFCTVCASQRNISAASWPTSGKNSLGSTLKVTARCVDLLTTDTEVVIKTLQWSVSWTGLGLDCFFHIWRWKPDEVLGGVISRAGGKTKRAKMTYSSLYFQSCKF